MQKLKKIRKFVLAIACTAVSMTAAGQDLLADIAPVDRKLRAIDSLSIVRLTQAEDAYAIPGEDLYPNWNNNYNNGYGVNIPSNYKIDVRGFCMPCASRKVTSHYGYRASFGRNHYGTDIKVYTGDTIYAAFSGKVRISKYNAGGYGYYVLIRHANGLETLYGHLSKQLVGENQFVKAGQPIGLGGSTGRSTGPHLHFETRFLGKFIDPEKIFSFEDRDIRSDYYVYAPSKEESEKMVAENVVAGEEIAQNIVAAAELAQNKADESHEFQQKRKAEQLAKPRAKVHKVKNGDNLYAIARKYGTTVDNICRLNRIKANSKLRAGQILRCS